MDAIHLPQFLQMLNLAPQKHETITDHWYDLTLLVKLHFKAGSPLGFDCKLQNIALTRHQQTNMISSE